MKPLNKILRGALLHLFTKQQALKIKKKLVDVRRKNEDRKREKESEDVTRW